MITKVREFNGLIKDRMFKVFFKKQETLIDFLNSYFEYINSGRRVKYVEVTPQVFIAPNNVKKKDYYGDVLATLDNEELILIEAYTYFKQNEYKKSNCYITRLYSNQMEFGETNYLKCQKATCLNLMEGNYKNMNPNLVNRHVTKHNNTNKTIEDSATEMVLIRLDLVEKSRYDNSNKRFIKWLKIINAKTIEEMEKIAGGDGVMNQSIEYIKWYSKNLNHGFQDVLNDVAYEVEEETRAQTRKETAKNTKLDIAKKLLSLNIDIKDVMKATGLSEKQIKKLQN